MQLGKPVSKRMMGNKCEGYKVELRVKFRKPSVSLNHVKAI